MKLMGIECIRVEDDGDYISKEIYINTDKTD